MISRDDVGRGRNLKAAFERRILRAGDVNHGEAVGHDLGVDAANRRAIACYRRTGFAYVGTWPRAMKTAAGVVDAYWMSITPTVVSSLR